MGCEWSRRSPVSHNGITSEEPLCRNFFLVWLDLNFDESDDVFRNSLIELRLIVNNVSTFNSPTQCLEFLSRIKDVKVLMIVSVALCEEVVPQVHALTQLDSIYVYRGGMAHYKQWAKDWPKVKGVFTEIDPLCESLKEIVHQFEPDSVPVSIISADAASKQNIDELDPSFMYTQLLKEILLEINYDDKSIKDFIVYCRKQYANDPKALETVIMFEQEYKSEKAIWWYTYECFLYRMLNKALRNLEIGNLMQLGFFIRNLHRQLDIQHDRQFGDKNIKSLTVYRGQSVCNADFEKIQKASGGLIPFNNFLLTSEDKNVSLGFGEGALTKPGFFGILFEMTIDKSIASSPFALFNDLSYFKDAEKEILFSTHTVFRIREIQPIEEGYLRWRIVLTLTHDNDPHLNAVTQCMRNETKGSTGWHRAPGTD